LLAPGEIKVFASTQSNVVPSRVPDRGGWILLGLHDLRFVYWHVVLLTQLPASSQQYQLLPETSMATGCRGFYKGSSKAQQAFDGWKSPIALDSVAGRARTALHSPKHCLSPRSMVSPVLSPALPGTGSLEPRSPGFPVTGCWAADPAATTCFGPANVACNVPSRAYRDAACAAGAPGINKQHLDERLHQLAQESDADGEDHEDDAGLECQALRDALDAIQEAADGAQRATATARDALALNRDATARVEQYWEGTPTRSQVHEMATQVVCKHLLPLVSLSSELKQAIQAAVHTEVLRTIGGSIAGAIKHALQVDGAINDAVHAEASRAVEAAIEAARPKPSVPAAAAGTARPQPSVTAASVTAGTGRTARKGRTAAAASEASPKRAPKRALSAKTTKPTKFPFGRR